MSHCSVPLCNYNSSTAKRKNLKRRALFAVRRPLLGKTPEDRKHRENLTKFLLSLRAAKNDNTIKLMLQKETAAICEAHFKPEDIINFKTSKRLRIGALPCYNIPVKKVFNPVLKHADAVQRFVPPNSKHRSGKEASSWDKVQCDYVNFEQLQAAPATNKRMLLAKRASEEVVFNKGKISVVKLEQLNLANFYVSDTSTNKVIVEVDSFDEDLTGNVEVAEDLPDLNDVFPTAIKTQITSKVDKRTLFEKMMYKLIQLLQEFCNRAYGSLKKANNSDENISQEYTKLLEKIEIIQKLNAVVEDQGDIINVIEKFVNIDNLDKWLDEKPDEQHHMEVDDNVKLEQHKTAVKNIETDKIQSPPPPKSTNLTNIPLQQVVFNTDGTVINSPNQRSLKPEILTPIECEPKKIYKADLNVSLAKKDNPSRKQLQVKRITKNKGIKEKNLLAKQEYEKYKIEDSNGTVYYKCDLCDSKYKIWYVLRAHHRQHAGWFNRTCDLCGKEFTRTYMKSHMLTHTKERRYACRICGAKFIRSTHLAGHIEQPYGCTFPAFQCQFCDENFYELEKINEHFTLIHCNSNWHCDKCNNTFTDDCVYAKHKLKLLKPYKCERCDLSYTFKASLKKHDREKHPKNKLTGSIDISESAMANTKTSIYMCDQCPKVFTVYKTYFSHKMSSHKRRKSHKTCTFCGKVFKSLHLYYVHRRIHTGAKPYKCEICLESFSLKKLLEQHPCVAAYNTIEEVLT